MVSAGLVAAVLLLAGAFLAWRGWRGVRVNEHPICRGCGFDLVGLSGACCPECGRGLAAKRAVTIGHRRRRVWMVLLGVILASLAAYPGGLVVMGRVKQFDWIRLRPDSMLERSVTAVEAAERQRELAELVRRLKAGNLRRSRIERLVRHALELQGNRDDLWETEWGDIVQEAHAQGLVLRQEWARYLKQAFPAATGLVSPALRGYPEPGRKNPSVGWVRIFELRVGPVRFGTDAPKDVAVHAELVRATLDGVSLRLHNWPAQPSDVGSFRFNRSMTYRTGFTFSGRLHDLSDDEALRTALKWKLQVLQFGEVVAEWEQPGEATDIQRYDRPYIGDL